MIQIRTNRGFVDVDTDTSIDLTWTNPFISNVQGGVTSTYSISIPLTKHNRELFDWTTEVFDDTIGSSWSVVVQVATRELYGKLVIESIDLENNRAETILILDYNDFLNMTLPSILQDDRRCSFEFLEKMPYSRDGAGISMLQYISPASLVHPNTVFIRDNTVSALPSCNLAQMFFSIMNTLGVDIRLNDQSVAAGRFSSDIDPYNYWIKAPKVRRQGAVKIVIYDDWNCQQYIDETSLRTGVRNPVTITTIDYNGNAYTETGTTADDFPKLKSVAGFELRTDQKVRNQGASASIKSPLYTLRALEDTEIEFPAGHACLSVVQNSRLYAYNRGYVGNNRGFIGQVSSGVDITFVSGFQVSNDGKLQQFNDYTGGTFEISVKKDSDDSVFPGLIVYFKDLAPDITLAKLISDFAVIVGGGFECYQVRGKWIVSIKTAGYSLDGSSYESVREVQRNELVKYFSAAQGRANIVKASDYSNYTPAFSRDYPVFVETLKESSDWSTLTLGAGGVYGSDFYLYCNDREAVIEEGSAIPSSYNKVNETAVWAYLPGTAIVSDSFARNIWWLDQGAGIESSISMSIHDLIMKATTLTTTVLMSDVEFIKMRYEGYKIFNIDGKDWIVYSCTVSDDGTAELVLVSFTLRK